MIPTQVTGTRLYLAVGRVSFLTICAGLLFGYSTASIAGWLDEIGREFSLGTGGKEYVTVSLVFCCFLGAIAAGPLARAFGRRITLLTAFGLAAAGYGLTLTHPDLPGLIAARVLIGLSVGLSSMAGPMYAGEATPARFRGSVVSLFQLAVTMGILAAYTVPLLIDDPAAWAYGIGVGGVIALAGFAALLMVPESPVWLARVGRNAEAETVSASLGLERVPVAEGSARPALSLWKTLRIGSTPAVLTLCCGLFILQNLSGIDGILYYAPAIFVDLGFSPGTAALGATFGLGLINLIATVVAIATVDRLGRRPLAIVGSLIMVIGLLGVVAAQVWSLPILGLIALCVYIGAFAVSLGPLPYVLMSELVPSTIRETGISVASATSWLFNALIAFVFLTGVSSIGLDGVFLIFAAVCVCSLVISLVWLPETKSRNLATIESNVIAGIPLRQLGDVDQGHVLRPDTGSDLK
ncbi:sugar porter family MFS transporter [Roseibium marinum]|uniref:Sugar porter (SP) family MFS transporter n=1 Tax=Roseibium marinum TaxID=281252 RepID=A0A2S3UJW7_9HYPH|nr:sugar porter family MFS transporter [Roseibium marinum]POF28014.1 sugar porter (SP) family MFS transporter [Roseibium marinum]